MFLFLTIWCLFFVGFAGAKEKNSMNRHPEITMQTRKNLINAFWQIYPKSHFLIRIIISTGLEQSKK